jgi:hypothetical protein
MPSEPGVLVQRFGQTLSELALPLDTKEMGASPAVEKIPSPVLAALDSLQPGHAFHYALGRLSPGPGVIVLVLAGEKQDNGTQRLSLLVLGKSGNPISNLEELKVRQDEDNRIRRVESLISPDFEIHSTIIIENGRYNSEGHWELLEKQEETLLYSLKPNGELLAKQSVRKKETENIPDGHFNFPLVPDSLSLQFRIDREAYKLEIRKDSVLIQTLDLETNTDLAVTPPEAFIERFDLNFDGWPDFRHEYSSGSGGIWYAVFLYDTLLHRFERDSFLSALSSPDLDTLNRRITHYPVGGGMGNMEFRVESFLFAEGRYELSEIYEQVALTDSVSGEEYWIRTRHTRSTDGKMETDCSVRIRPPEGGKQMRCLLEGNWKACSGEPFPVFPDRMEIIRTEAKNGQCD